MDRVCRLKARVQDREDGGRQGSDGNQRPEDSPTIICMTIVQVFIRKYREKYSTDNFKLALDFPPLDLRCQIQTERSLGR